MFFGIFTPVIIFNVAFEMDIYMFQKLLWQVIILFSYYCPFINCTNYFQTIKMFCFKMENKEKGESIGYQSGKFSFVSTNKPYIDNILADWKLRGKIVE